MLPAHFGIRKNTFRSYKYLCNQRKNLTNKVVLKSKQPKGCLFFLNQRYEVTYLAYLITKNKKRNIYNI